MYLHFFDKYINVLDFPDLLRTGLYVSNSEREALIDKRLMKLAKDNKDYILISDEKYKMIMINKSRK